MPAEVGGGDTVEEVSAAEGVPEMAEVTRPAACDHVNAPDLARAAADADWAVRLGGTLPHELVLLSLESHSEATTILQAVRDEAGRAVDFRMRFLNAAARAGQPDPAEAVGALGSVLWPQMVTNGTHAACLRVLSGGAPEAGSFLWSEGERYAAGGWEYRVARLDDEHALWTMRDESLRVQQVVEANSVAEAALGHAEQLQQLTEGLARALTVEEVLQVVLTTGGGLLGAARSGVAVREGEVDVLRYQGLGRGSRSVPPGIRTLRVEDDFPGSRAVRERRVITYASREELEAAHPGKLVLASHPDEHSWVLVPVLSRTQILGVVRFAFTEQRHLTPTESHLLQALASQCAVALERIELLERERRAHEQAAAAAELLQRSLLPQLPTISGLEIAARYLPGETGTQVGGDWYDVIELGAGRVAVVVGDVMGRGVRAAAVMGQLRAAVRAYAQLELAPADILILLDRLVEQLQAEQLVTCCYGVYDTSLRELRLASAGHLPPLVVSSAGVRSLEVLPAPPLGTGIWKVEEERFVLEPGECLVLYTDGLVEASTHDIDAGIEVLSATLERGWEETQGESMDELADLVIQGTSAQVSQDDDTALLLLRLLGCQRGVVGEFQTDLGFSPTAASEARRFVTQHAGELGMGEECQERAVLLASELVGNVLRHASGPITLQLRASDQTCFMEVGDGTSYRPQRRRAKITDESGRGLELVEVLGRSWGVRPRASGKVVWVELELDPEPSLGDEAGDAALAEAYLSDLGLDLESLRELEG